MQVRHLGSRSASVSRLGLGTMTWSRDTGMEEAARLLDVFLDAGGTLIDTAARFADGGAERLLGQLLERVFPRDELWITSKAGLGASGAVDASRGGLLDVLDGSLRRLGTDHLDLWIVEGHDQATPPEETAHAMEVALASGKARHVGLSDMPAWAMTRIASAARPGAGPAVAQFEYSLLERGIEREVLPAAGALGMGLFAWAPLGRGVLTGKYAHAIPADSRAASDHLAHLVDGHASARSQGIVSAVIAAAQGLGRSAHEVALAWLRDAPGVTGAIVGARTAEQLITSIGAEDLELPEQIRTALDDVCAPALGYPERCAPWQG